MRLDVLIPYFSDCFSDDGRINIEVIAMKGQGGVFCRANDFEEAKSIFDSARVKRVLG
jgi:pentatricopeptide repeat protein